jgi:PII-like signaling protein
MGWIANAVLLRLYVAEDERVSGRPLHELLFERMQRRGLRHLALLRAPRGLASTPVRGSPKLLSLRAHHNLPLILEAIDTAPHVEAFLEEITTFTRRGLATLQDVRAWDYGEGNSEFTGWAAEGSKETN